MSAEKSRNQTKSSINRERTRMNAYRVKRSAPWSIRAGGIAIVVCFFLLVFRFWHPVYEFTSFFQLDASNDDRKLAAFHELPVYVYRNTGGYDGLFYSQLALDPSLRDPGFPRAMDDYTYRARRILPPALGWIMGLGHASWIIRAYSILNVIAWLVLAGVLWRLLAVCDLYGLIGWAGVMMSAGALCSVRLALTDLVATALIAATVAAAEQERKRTALGFVAAAALARETSLLAVAGLVKPPWLSFKNAVRITAAALPLALWMLYIRWRVGPNDQGLGNLTWPVVGFLRKWAATLTASSQTEDTWLAWGTLLALVGMTAQAVYLLRWPNLRDRWWRVGAAYIVLMACLGTAVWEGFPGAATRVLLPLTLAFNVAAERARASLTWLIVGNLSFVAGLVAMRDVPNNPRELTARRSGDRACIVTIGDNWYGRESRHGHHWMWSSQKATLNLETWPRQVAIVRLEFALRSLSPRPVVLREDGREIWHTQVGTERTPCSVEVKVTGGNATLEFATSTPPIRESSTPKARPLGFALYDLHLDLPEK